MFEDESELRQLNVNKKLLVSLPHSHRVTVISRPSWIMYVCSRSWLLEGKARKDVGKIRSSVKNLKERV